MFRGLVKYGRHGVLLCQGQGIQPLNSSARDTAAVVIIVDLFRSFSHESVSAILHVIFCVRLCSCAKGLDCGEPIEDITLRGPPD